ncbi:MAG: InlB B-repeat-containing protein [Mycoplasmatales bacterium]
MRSGFIKKINMLMIALLVCQSINIGSLLFIASTVNQQDNSDIVEKNPSTNLDQQESIEKVPDKTEEVTKPVVDPVEPTQSEPAVKVPSDVTSEETQSSEQSLQKQAQKNQKPIVQNNQLSSKLFANFDNQDLATNPIFTYDALELAQKSRKLTVNETFPVGNDITKPQMTLNINNVLQLKNAPGLEYDKTTVWKFNRNKLPVYLKGIVNNAIYTPNNQLDGLNDTTGTLTYTFSEGVSSVSLDFLLSDSQNYGFTNELVDEEFVNPLEITTSYLKANVKTEFGKQKIATVVLTKGTGINLYFSNGNEIISNTANTTSKFVIRPYSYVKNPIYLIEKTYVKKATFKIKIPKNIIYKDISNVKGFTSVKVLSVDTDTDANNTIVEIEANEFYTNANYEFSVNYQVPADAVAAKINAFSLENPLVVQSIDGKVINFQKAISRFPAQININNKTVNTLTIDGYGTQNLSFQEGLQETTNFLGGFSLYNENISEVKNQKVKLDFSSSIGTIGVESFSVPQTKGIKNLSVITTNDNVKKIALTTETFISKKMLSLAEGEYIKTVTWEWLEVFPEGYLPNGTNSRDFNYINTIPIKYYGKYFTSSLTSYSAKATVVDTKLPFTHESASSTTGTINVTSSKYMTFQTASNLDTNVQSGETYKAEISTDMMHHKYSDNSVMKAKGFIFYLSEKNYFSIEPNTIVVTWNGQEFTPKDGSLVYAKTIDNQGDVVYAVQLDQAILGYSEFDKEKYDPIKIKYDLKILSSAPTGSLNASELFQIRPASEMLSVISKGEADIYHDINRLNVTGTDDLSEQLGVAPKNQQLNNISQNDFTVNTAANLNDGAWKTYDNDTATGEINLNPAGTSKYKLSIYNNTGISVDGFTALIPIPKAGEKTKLTPALPSEFDPSVHLQPGPFEWTLSLQNPLVVNNQYKYTILYSTKYETDKDGPSFVSWEQIVDKNQIRMIKVETNDTIPDNGSDQIVFPLALTDPKPEENAGKINIYGARIYKNVGGTEGYAPSELVGIRLKTGVISGQVFTDINRNGLFDNTETGKNGVGVIAYEAGTKTVIDSTITKTIVGKNGSYQFMGLDKRQNVDVVFINPTADDSMRYTFFNENGSVAKPSDDNTYSIVKSVVPSTVNAFKINAGLMTPLKLKFDAQGGQVTNSKTELDIYPKDIIEKAPVATKPGYTIEGWYTKSSGGTKINFPFTFGFTEVTLFANYIPNQYKVTYNDEGKTTVKVETFGELITMPKPNPTQPNQTFVGWNTKADGKGKMWDFGTDKMIANDLNLYAIYIINQYDITFNLNGGNGPAPASQSAPAGVLIKEPVVPTRTGYSFSQWNTKADGSGETWDFANSKTPSGNLVLYAIWSISEFELSFNVNGGDSVAPTTQLVTFGKLATEPSEPTRIGYRFAGWNTKIDGMGTTWNFATTTMPGIKTTLHAIWIANEYNVIFNINGGEGAAPSAQKVDFDKFVVKPKDPIRIGYTFVDWNTKQDGTGKTWSFTTDKMPSGALTLYAQWEIASFELNFNLNGGTSVGIAKQTVIFNELATEVEVPTRNHYTFIGWNTKIDGSGETWDFASSKMPGADTTLYAQWKSNENILTFNINGGEGKRPLDQKIKYNELAVKPTDPSRTGYQFSSWNTKSDGTGDTWNFATSRMPDENVILYAIWSEKEFQLSFNLNGGEGQTPTSQNIKYQAFAKKPADPIKNGYEFSSWNTKIDGTGETWDFATTAMPANNIKLFAQWDVKSYEMTFDLNGGLGQKPVTQVVDYNTLATKPTGEFTKYQYNFTGWNTKADGTGKQWDFSIDKMPPRNIVLYAKWIPNIYNVTLIGQTITLHWEKYYGRTFPEPTLPIKPGYTLEGWYVEGVQPSGLKTKTVTEIANLSTTNLAASSIYNGKKWNFATDTVPPFNFTLRAKYSPKPYPVAFINSKEEIQKTVIFNQLVPKPKEPKNLRYPNAPFIGWYTKSTGGEKWDFEKNKMPPKKLYLYARYGKNPKLSKTGMDATWSLIILGSSILIIANLIIRKKQK